MTSAEVFDVLVYVGLLGFTLAVLLILAVPVIDWVRRLRD